MTSDIESRLRDVARAICENWNDLPESVRDGANACSNAADQLQHAKEALRPFKSAAAIFDKLPYPPGDDAGCQYYLPRVWPTVGDLRRTAAVLAELEK